MAFEVTANRKRPRNFDQLAGQEFVVSTLKNSLRSGRIAHAFLFSGPRGVGKTSAARILAKALNCSEYDEPTENPCDVCTNCREITSGNSLDVLEIDGASNTSVNDIRRIKDEVLFSPTSCRKKVYIIDEVHMLSNSAFNALLKTIEEPPEYVVFIFATTEIHKVPATIRSRCQQYHFQLFPIEVIIDLLGKTAEESSVVIEDDALFWIAKEATGSMRDAYTLFDQIVALAITESGQSGEETAQTCVISMDLIRDKLGLVGIDVINILVEAMSRGNAGEAVEIVHDTLHRGVSVEQLVTDTVEYFRALLLIRQGITRDALIGSRLEQISQTVIRAYSKEQLEAAIELLLELYRNIRYSLNPRFEVELAFSRLADLHRLVSHTTLVGRLASLKDQLLRGEFTGGKDPVSVAKPEIIPKPDTPEQLTEERHKPAFSESEKSPDFSPVEITRNHIESVQAELKNDYPALAAALGKIVDWHYHDSILELIFPDAYTAGKIAGSTSVIQQAFFSLLDTRLDLKIITAADHDREHEHAQSEPDGDSDSAVEMVKSIFRGSVIQD